MYQKKISVCIATFNGEDYIEQQLNSIRFQLNDFDEIIISDDGSTDNTVEIIKALKDHRIQIYKNRKKKFNYGHYYVSANFENALKKSNGDIIFLADQDDIWCPNRLEVSLKYLNDYDLVINNAFVIDENGKLLENTFFDDNMIFPRGIINNIISPKYHGCCMAFHKSVLEYALPFPSKLILHDSWIGMLTEYFGKVTYINDNLIFYRRHFSNASFLEGKSKNSLLFKIVYRIELLSSYFIRILKKR